MFAAIVSRPDIMYAVTVVSRFLANPSKEHWTAVKKIIKYLKNTMNHGIMFDGKYDDLKLVGYSDSDYAGDPDSRKSTSGYLFKLANGPVTWMSRRQPVVALSTTEAEYIAASDATREAVWLSRLLSSVGVEHVEPIRINMDNQGSFYQTSEESGISQKNQTHRSAVPLHSRLFQKRAN